MGNAAVIEAMCCFFFRFFDREISCSFYDSRQFQKTHFQSTNLVCLCCLWHGYLKVHFSFFIEASCDVCGKSIKIKEKLKSNMTLSMYVYIYTTQNMWIS
jgi:hypothetical protein